MATPFLSFFGGGANACPELPSSAEALRRGNPNTFKFARGILSRKLQASYSPDIF